MKTSSLRLILALMLLLPFQSWAAGPVAGSRFEKVLIPDDQVTDCGHKGKISQVQRSLTVETAQGFSSAELPAFTVGETVRFTFHNASKRTQLVILGSQAEFKKFAIRLNERGHRLYLAPNFVYLSPGEARELIWSFAAATDCQLDVQTRAPMALWESQGRKAFTIQPSQVLPEDSHSH